MTIIALMIAAAIAAGSFIYKIGELTFAKLKEEWRRFHTLRAARMYALADLRAIVRDPDVSRINLAELDRMIEEGCTYAEVQASSNGELVGNASIYKKEYPDQDEDPEVAALLARNNGVYIDYSDRVIETPASAVRTAGQYGAKITIIGE